MLYYIYYIILYYMKDIRVKFELNNTLKNGPDLCSFATSHCQKWCLKAVNIEICQVWIKLGPAQHTSKVKCGRSLKKTK